MIDSQKPGSYLSAFAAEWRTKVAITILLNVWIDIPYFGAQYYYLREPMIMPATFLDRLVPFLPWTVGLYLSLYLFMPVAPLLMQRKDQLWRYASGMASLGAIGNIIFFFRPTQCPRPPAGDANFLYQLLTTMDRPVNAFPSLHAAFVIFALLCSFQVGLTRKCLIGLHVWACLILFATLSTRQHVALDILAGSLMAVGAYSVLFRKCLAAKSSILQPTLSTT